MGRFVQVRQGRCCLLGRRGTGLAEPRGRDQARGRDQIGFSGLLLPLWGAGSWRLEGCRQEVKFEP